MKRYKSPYLKNEKRRGRPDRREDSLTKVLNELAPALKDYLDAYAQFQERRAESELKKAKAIEKIVDSLSDLKIRISGSAGQPYRQRKKHKRSEDEHHRQVKQIILRMRAKDATYQEIAEYLEKNNIPTFRGRGRWHAQTVHRLYQGYIDEQGA